MTDILLIVLPVFVIIGLGYAFTKAKLLPDANVDVLIRFCTTFAIPCLLFSGVVRLDLAAYFDWRLMVSFYAGALAAFAIGFVLARTVFKRRPGESVAIAFCALFSNSLLLGIPVTERAYGVSALDANYAILSIHAPFCYLVGIVSMEFARADGRRPRDTFMAAGRAMFRNSLTIGIALGILVNLSGLPLPQPIFDGVQTLGRGGVPVALFAIGGALTRYSIRAGFWPALTMAGLSLLLHPLIVWGLAEGVFDLPDNFLRSAIVTASMPPGINAYLFAAMYARATGVVASTVLLATGLAIVTATGWLALLHQIAP